MKVLSIYQDENMPSSRIRVLQMVPWLQQQGVSVDTLVYPKRLHERWELLKRCSDYDLIWLQKKLPSSLDLAFWKRIKPPLVFDFDDAICFRQKPKKGSYESQARMKKFSAIIKSASGITCGNDYLASLAEPFSQAPTLVYPSAVPVEVPVHNYQAPRQDKPVVGWIGGKGNLHSLESLGERLAAVNAVIPFTLRVISDAEFHFMDLDIDNVRWSLDTQEQQVATFDIGLMPLDATSPFDKGKCAYKLLQYMASGVAVVGSDVGMNAKVISPGKNGQLVSDQQCYTDTLIEMLTLPPEALANMGKAGRELMIEQYSYPSLATELLNFFQKILLSNR